jgi:hypothetical protein
MPKSEKIVGYALLILGVILILFSTVEMVTVYFGDAPPPKLFDLEDISISINPISTAAATIPGSQLSQLPNLIFWFFLMGFLLLAGGKISSLGVNLIKEIHVEVHDSATTPPPPSTNGKSV